MTNKGNIPTLSRTEWQAVSIGLQDALKYGCAGPPELGSLKARLQRLLSLVCGIEPPRPLADPRLEALRRFVCSARRGQPIKNEHAPTLIEQGFSPLQLNAIALLADQLRLRPDSRCSRQD